MTKTIFLDLDGTLKSCIDKIALDRGGVVRTITENWRGEDEGYSFIQRPHLHHFLKSLDETGWTINLSTMGHQSYAIKCLEAMGVREYFTLLFCGVGFRQASKYSKFTIVDDRDYLLEWKAEQLSYDCRFAEITKILIPTYLGGEDDELLKLADKLTCQETK